MSSLPGTSAPPAWMSSHHPELSCRPAFCREGRSEVQQLKRPSFYGPLRGMVRCRAAAVKSSAARAVVDPAPSTSTQAGSPRSSSSVATSTTSATVESEVPMLAVPWDQPPALIVQRRSFYEGLLVAGREGSGAGRRKRSGSRPRRADAKASQADGGTDRLSGQADGSTDRLSGQVAGADEAGEALQEGNACSTSSREASGGVLAMRLAAQEEKEETQETAAALLESVGDSMSDRAELRSATSVVDSTGDVAEVLVLPDEAPPEVVADVAAPSPETAVEPTAEAAAAPLERVGDTMSDRAELRSVTSVVDSVRDAECCAVEVLMRSEVPPEVVVDVVAPSPETAVERAAEVRQASAEMAVSPSSASPLATTTDAVEAADVFWDRYRCTGFQRWADSLDSDGDGLGSDEGPCRLDAVSVEVSSAFAAASTAPLDPSKSSDSARSPSWRRHQEEGGSSRQKRAAWQPTARAREGSAWCRSQSSQGLAARSEEWWHHKGWRSTSQEWRPRQAWRQVTPDWRAADREWSPHSRWEGAPSQSSAASPQWRRRRRR